MHSYEPQGQEKGQSWIQRSLAYTEIKAQNYERLSTPYHGKDGSRKWTLGLFFWPVTFPQ